MSEEWQQQGEWQQQRNPKNKWQWSAKLAKQYNWTYCGRGSCEHCTKWSQLQVPFCTACGSKWNKNVIETAIALGNDLTGLQGTSVESKGKGGGLAGKGHSKGKGNDHKGPSKGLGKAGKGIATAEARPPPGAERNAVRLSEGGSPPWQRGNQQTSASAEQSIEQLSQQLEKLQKQLAEVMASNRREAEEGVSTTTSTAPGTAGTPATGPATITVSS